MIQHCHRLHGPRRCRTAATAVASAMGLCAHNVPHRAVAGVVAARAFSGHARAALPWNTIVKFVPQQDSWVVERFGRYSRVLEPGLALLIPIVEQIAYAHSMKEVAVEIPSQSAITMDNVSLELDGVLYYKITDAYSASYGVEDPHFAIAQMAQTTMRAQIGMLSLDRTLAERTLLNTRIVAAINEAAATWGIECLRYEVRDVHLPKTVLQSMHSQVAAERSKRATILESEGKRQAAINVAEGDRQAQILASESELQETVNRAEGAARAVRLEAEAAAESLRTVADAIAARPEARDAVALDVAKRWVSAWAGIAKNAGSVVIVPAGAGGAGGAGDPMSMIAQGVSLFSRLTGKNSPLGPGSSLLSDAAGVVKTAIDADDSIVTAPAGAK